MEADDDDDALERRPRRETETAGSGTEEVSEKKPSRQNPVIKDVAKLPNFELDEFRLFRTFIAKLDESSIEDLMPASGEKEEILSDVLFHVDKLVKLWKPLIQIK